MEAVSAGAGVLTFITVALQSTKKIYEAVSGITKGPEQLESLAAAVETLHSVLTQFSNCPVVDTADAKTDLELIWGLIKTCSEDVLRYEKELGKVSISSDDKRAGRAWKKLKTFLQEKDLQRIRIGVNHHISALGFQLNILQS
jgi:Fungal N-terminal domain of STAND proteins